MTSERDLLACRASRRATTSVSRLRVKLTRLGLRNDFGLPILVTAHFMRKNGRRQAWSVVRVSCPLSLVRCAWSVVRKKLNTEDLVSVCD
jgi:hypothetical protein